MADVPTTEDLLRQMNSDFVARMKTMSDDEAQVFTDLSSKLSQETEAFIQKCTQYMQAPIKEPIVGTSSGSSPDASGPTSGGAAPTK